MSGLESFKEWARAAREEKGPKPEVSAAVLDRLAAEGAAAETHAGLWGLAGASAFAAVLCAAWGLDAWGVLLGDWYGWTQDFGPWSYL